MDIILWSIFVLILLAFLVAFGVFFVSKKKAFNPKDKAFFQEKWKVILALPDGHRAILEADKLLDFALKKKNYAGTLGEKLRSAEKLFADIDGLWTAHKLRNRLAHDVHVQVSAKEIRQALRSFERALKDLHAF